MNSSPSHLVALPSPLPLPLPCYIPPFSQPSYSLFLHSPTLFWFSNCLLFPFFCFMAPWRIPSPYTPPSSPFPLIFLPTLLILPPPSPFSTLFIPFSFPPILPYPLLFSRSPPSLLLPSPYFPCLSISLLLLHFFPTLVYIHNVHGSMDI